MAKYRLAIEDRVAVRVKRKIQGASRGTHINVDFTLDMERMDQDQINDAIANSGESIADFLVKKTRGWDGQRLVLDESDMPAAFCEESYRALLKYPGMTVAIWQDYMRDLGVQEKN
jgi:hypothetical protein